LVRVSEAPNILLLNLNHIGDVLFTTPAIRALRDKYPSARIVCVVSSTVAAVLHGNPNIDRLEVRQRKGLMNSLLTGLILRSERFDISICFSFSSFDLAAIASIAGVKKRVGFAYPQIRSLLNMTVRDDESKHRVESYLDLVRAITSVESSYPMEMFVSEEDLAFAEGFLSSEGFSMDRPLVGLNPGGSKRHNMWFPDRFAAVADLLQHSGAGVIIFGGASEVALAQEIASKMETPPVIAAGRATIGQSAALISRCAIFISGDTGPLHMAVSLGIPSVAIFGPTDPGRTGMYTDKGVTLWPNVPCSPCTREPTCSFKECMDAVTVNMVFDAAEKLLAESVTGEPLVEATE
jgi:heptosyltransferase II